MTAALMALAVFLGATHRPWGVIVGGGILLILWERNPERFMLTLFYAVGGFLAIDAMLDWIVLGGGARIIAYALAAALAARIVWKDPAGLWRSIRGLWPDLLTAAPAASAFIFAPPADEAGVALIALSGAALVALRRVFVRRWRAAVAEVFVPGRPVPE